jgi:cytochrome c biogenesis factor
MRVGNVIIVIGGIVVLVGLLVRLVPGAFSWFGRLPGDIRIESSSSRVFIPITSMIVVSVVLSVAFSLLNRWRS